MNHSTGTPIKAIKQPPAKPNPFICVSRWLDAIDAGDTQAAWTNLAALARHTLATDKRGAAR